MQSSTARRRTVARGFDFTAAMRRLCQDACRRLPALGHVDFRRVAVGYRQTRKAVSYGLQASMTPMRFERGRPHAVRQGRKWTMQRLHDASGHEFLYILTFYLPRFLDHPFREKLVTIFHELWHISPEFDGDLRRHPGRCYAHSHSQDEYDERAGRMADAWLQLDPPRRVYEFLELDFRQLASRHHGVYGMRFPTPKLIPAD